MTSKTLVDLRMIRKIWLKSDGTHFCISTKSSSGKWKDHFFNRRSIGKAITFAQDHAKTHDVYMGTHGYTGSRRVKELSVDPALLYSDLDEMNPDRCELRPTIAIESSPGRYVGYWLTDEPVPEELNRRFNYFIGADKSGWDRTQVLRVPGTRNFKYSAKPRVKVLWSDGPRYEVSKLSKMIPEPEEEGSTEANDAAEIYAEYESSLPRDIRREFTNPKVQQGKRSEVLWKMLSACLEAGMTEEETFTLCWGNPWNKHAERARGGERQMRREIDKIRNSHVGGSRKKPPKKKRVLKRINGSSAPAADSQPDASEFQPFNVLAMNEVEEEEVDWLIPRMIGRGQTTIFEGDPGVGKSYLLMWIARHFCDGVLLPWLDPKHEKPVRCKVLYCDMENSAGAITKTRLADNGLKNSKDYYQLTQPFSVDDEESFGRFEATIAQIRPGVVIIDPVNLYVGGADTYRASEVQQALQHMKSLSEEYNFALVIVRHLNKGATGKALYAGNGSIAFAGVARVIATVGWHPEDADTRVVACTKNNLSKFFGSFGYTIEGLPDTLKRKDRSRLEYEGHLSYTSDDIVATTNQKDESSLHVAGDLIREMLDKDGKVNYHQLLSAADTRSITEKTIKKAAAELGLKKLTKGRGSSRATFLVMPK